MEIDRKISRFIRFSTDLRFNPFQKIRKKIDFGEIGHYRFNCHYKADASTSESDYNITVLAKTDEVDQFVTWDDSINMAFYSDQNFKTTVKTTSLLVGQTFFYQISWLDLGTSFPAKFFVKDCTIGNGKNSYFIDYYNNETIGYCR